MIYPKTKIKPWDHQVTAWNLAKDSKSFYYAMDMGTGKSKAAIDYFNGLGLTAVLIVCPKNVIEVWPEQFAIHSHTPFNVVYDMSKLTIAKKVAGFKRKIDSNIVSGIPFALVVNYESFWREPLGPIKNKYGHIKRPGFLLSQLWDVMVFDEAHRIKSPGGKASWGAKMLANSIPKKLFLSGTPMPHSPLDIYAQYRALDPTVFGTNFSHFRQRYCVMGGYENRQVIEWVNKQEMHDRMFSKMYMVKKRDVLDLPPVMHEKRMVSLSPKMQKTYDEFDKEFFMEIDLGEMTADNALVKLLRLTQMTAGIIQLDDGTRIAGDDAKLKEIEDILTDLPEDEPVVICAKFTPELQRVKLICSKLNRSCAELSGKMNQLQEWKAGKFNCLAVQIQAGKEGVDLTRSAYVIFSSTGCSLGDYEQFLARTDRPGQTRSVTYYHILAKSTVDLKIANALKNKKNVVQSIMGIP